MSETYKLLLNFYNNWKIHNRTAMFQINANEDNDKICFTRQYKYRLEELMSKVMLNIAAYIKG